MRKKNKTMKSILNKLTVSFLLFLSFAPGWASETVSVYPNNRQFHEAFVLFYLSSCIHCKRFEPVLKEYAETHHTPVLAYTLDGRSLPGFPNSATPNQNEMNRFFPSHNPVAPTLFLMDLDSHTIRPVLKGEASSFQLNSRMSQLHSKGGRYGD